MMDGLYSTATTVDGYDTSMFDTSGALALLLRAGVVWMDSGTSRLMVGDPGAPEPLSFSDVEGLVDTFADEAP